MIAQVIVDHRSKMVDKVFDYLIPDELTGLVGVGARVIVPFSSGNAEKEGFCVGVTGKSGGKRLKSIIRLAGNDRAFDEKMLETIEFMRERYLTSYLDLIHAVVPAGTDIVSEEWITIKELRQERSQIRKKIIECLLDNGGGMEYGALSAMLNKDVKPQLRDMIKKGALQREYRHSQGVKEKTIRAVRLAIAPENAVAEAVKMSGKAPVQSNMLQILAVNEFIAVSDLKKFAGGSYNAVSALAGKGFVKIFDLEIERNPLKNKTVKKTRAFTMTDEQSDAVKALTGSMDNGKFNEFLLYGVTGSGKTEVFMQSIEHAVKMGKTALVLVPEISLTPQMVSRFMSRFGERIAVLHSKLSLGERYDQWRRIRSGGADIVIGARSAVFAPLDNIGIIIVDEEHSETYKSEMSPRYSAKEVASFRGRQYGAAVVFASATPSMESFYKAKKGEYTLLTMKKRCNNNKMPPVTVVDMRRELDEGNRSMFSRLLRNELEVNLKKGEQTILFLNRRGFSTFVSCRKCGYTAECPNCNISLTYHKFDNVLKCHYCGYTHPNYTLCPRCGSKYIRYFGGGTQRVEEEIHKLFPDASVLRMDVDTTGRKESHEKLLERFEKEKTDILIGTQMVAKGLDFENVTLVGVVSADTMLHINDYRSAERTFSMLEQVTGRAGRGAKKGRAIVQTYSPEEEAIALSAVHNYVGFYGKEIEKRRIMWYPPYSDMINIVFSGTSEAIVPQAAKYFLKLMGDIRSMNQRIQLLGPVPSGISKIKNKYRWQILIKCENADALNGVLKKACDGCLKNKNYRSVSIITDKNPNMIY